MLKLMRNELNNALKRNMPLAALVDALSLLDGISKVEYPNETSQRKRYEDWWDNFVRHSDDDLDGSTVYQIRCFIMHETRMAMCSKDIDILALSISSNFSGVGTHSIGELDGKSYYRLDLHGFCIQVCNAFDEYYDTHKDVVDSTDAELFVVTDEDIERCKAGCMTVLGLCRGIAMLHDGNSFVK